MAVAYISDTDKAPATASSFTFTSFAVSGSNPVIIVCVGLDTSVLGAGAGVSGVAVSAGLTSGTPVQVATVAETGSARTRVSIWAIPAPSGTGTITVTLSGSMAYQATAVLLQGADQTTPCPTGDAGTAQNATSTNPLSITCSNLTANDAVVGIGANATTGDNPHWTAGTEILANNTSAVNAAAGYKLGTGAVTVSWGSGHQVCVMAAVRVAASGASAKILPAASTSYILTGTVADIRRGQRIWLLYRRPAS